MALKQSPCKTFVCVDLGNVHDVLKPLEKFVLDGTVEARGFADFAFKGYGVKPRSKIPVEQARTVHRNAADIAMVWYLALKCKTASESGQCLNIIVATKDIGFQSLQEQVESFPGFKCIFVTGWKQLKWFLPD